jgi:hypothetical protein
MLGVKNVNASILLKYEGIDESKSFQLLSWRARRMDALDYLEVIDLAPRSVKLLTNKDAAIRGIWSNNQSCGDRFFFSKLVTLNRGVFCCKTNPFLKVCSEIQEVFIWVNSNSLCIEISLNSPESSVIRELTNY